MTTLESRHIATPESFGASAELSFGCNDDLDQPSVPLGECAFTVGFLTASAAVDYTY
jgi:hypothetical protein